MTAVFTTSVSRIAEQVRLTAVVPYSGEVEGLIVMFSCGGRTVANISNYDGMISTSVLFTFYLKNFLVA